MSDVRPSSRRHLRYEPFARFLDDTRTARVAYADHALARVMYTLHKTSRTALPAVLRHPPCPSVGILCNPTEHMLVVLRQYMMWLASMRGQPFPFLVDVSNNDVGWHPCGVSHFPFLVDVAHNDVAAAYIASPSGSARMAQGTISNVRTLLKQLCKHCSQGGVACSNTCLRRCWPNPCSNTS